MTPQALDRFTIAYLICALWSSTDDDDDPMDDNYDLSDLAPETIQRAHNDCTAFQLAHADDIAQGHGGRDSDGTPFDELERAGHDLWLTRNGHGAGFQDAYKGHPYPDDVAERLSDAARALHELHLYVGDDEGYLCVQVENQSAIDAWHKADERYDDCGSELHYYVTVRVGETAEGQA